MSNPIPDSIHAYPGQSAKPSSSEKPAYPSKTTRPSTAYDTPSKQDIATFPERPIPDTVRVTPTRESIRATPSREVTRPMASSADNSEYTLLQLGTTLLSRAALTSVGALAVAPLERAVLMQQIDTELIEAGVIDRPFSGLGSAIAFLRANDPSGALWRGVAARILAEFMEALCSVAIPSLTLFFPVQSDAGVLFLVTLDDALSRLVSHPFLTIATRYSADLRVAPRAAPGAVARPGSTGYRFRSWLDAAKVGDRYAGFVPQILAHAVRLYVGVLGMMLAQQILGPERQAALLGVRVALQVATTAAVHPLLTHSRRAMVRAVLFDGKTEQPVRPVDTMWRGFLSQLLSSAASSVVYGVSVTALQVLLQISQGQTVQGYQAA